MELLERDGELATLSTAIAESHSVGRIAVVAGEAGIGKTALVTAACAGRRVLWGACDPLLTPRPLGALRDALPAASSREALLAAALDELEGGTPLVVDDLHWADDATLDLVALLGRRLARRSGCLLVTCRSEALDGRPEVRRVLDALPRDCVRRIEPRPLSPAAVAALAHAAGRVDGDVHAITGGNPFFVTEALGAGAGETVPGSVRDAIALRAAALDAPARDVLEVAAVVPGPAEPWVVSAATGAGTDAIDACIAAGLLELRGEAVAFRHDLARRAVEEAIPPLRRRARDAAVLAALEARGGADPARLAHHARRTGDPEAIGRHAPVAARAASAAGGHRQAFEQWEAALAAAPADPSEALEGVSVEGYLCGHLDRALEARRALLARHEVAGDARAAGDDLRWLSRILWWAGRGQEAAAAGERAIATLEAFPEAPELAMALSASSQLAMLAGRNEEAIERGMRAVALARRLGDRETEAHALTNVGSAMTGGPDSGRARALLEEAFALAAEHGFHDHAARALVNQASGLLMRHRDDPRVEDDLERALAFTRERELDGYVQYLLGGRAHLRLLRGDWAGAEADARESLAFGEHLGVSLCPALMAIGRLQARRGDGDAAATLQDAWERAQATGELQRLGPAAAARAENAWLDGDLEGVVAVARPVYELAVARGDAWARGELGWWLWRAGAPVPSHDGDPEPYARAVAGDAVGAAAAWEALGFPYERADALSDGDEGARIEALAVFDGFGAVRSAARLRRRLRADGVRRIPRGPRPATRAGVAGLTPRQAEVLALLARGATNAEIAEALVITPKTVDHHVSAVLAKLGVASRREAASAASRLGAGA